MAKARFLINSAKICGIKNIDKEVSFSFTNKVMTDKSFDESYVKTIYGSNGAGKSGIVHAFEIAKTIATKEYPFKDALFASKLIELINKKTKRLSIEIVFTSSDKERYRYSLAISLTKDLRPYISYESLEELTLRGETKALCFKVENGVLSPNSHSDYINANIDPSFAMASSCILPMVDDYLLWSESAFVAFTFFVSLQVVFGGESDKHAFYDIKSYRRILQETKGKDKPYSLDCLSMASIASQACGDKYLWVLESEEEGRYKAIAKKLNSFLQLVRPSLKDVGISFKREGSLSYAELCFDYGDYSIDYEFESSGVKKLCMLFTAFANASSGFVVIIDEIDADIHDMFLANLMEYFVLYCPCQIIVTTHNIDLMDSVKGLSKSIDILTDEPSVVPWVKRGTLSPISQYKKGYLGGVPVNLNPIDFAPLFNDKS